MKAYTLTHTQTDSREISHSAIIWIVPFNRWWDSGSSNGQSKYNFGPWQKVNCIMKCYKPKLCVFLTTNLIYSMSLCCQRACLSAVCDVSVLRSDLFCWHLQYFHKNMLNAHCGLTDTQIQATHKQVNNFYSYVKRFYLLKHKQIADKEECSGKWADITLVGKHLLSIASCPPPAKRTKDRVRGASSLLYACVLKMFNCMKYYLLFWLNLHLQRPPGMREKKHWLYDL